MVAIPRLFYPDHTHLHGLLAPLDRGLHGSQLRPEAVPVLLQGLLLRRQQLALLRELDAPPGRVGVCARSLVSRGLALGLQLRHRRVEGGTGRVYLRTIRDQLALLRLRRGLPAALGCFEGGGLQQGHRKGR